MYNMFHVEQKNKKIMAATNYTIVRRNKKTNTILLDELTNKWTYKQALAIAKESATDAFELVCVIESNKIMLKDEKENEENCISIICCSYISSM